LSRISSTSGHPDVPDIIDWGNLSQWMVLTMAGGSFELSHRPLA
jgi:hypothetical protein